MSENETWLSLFLKENPTDKVNIDPYYTDKIDTIRNEIDKQLEFIISNEQLDRALQAWQYRDVLIQRCNQLDFSHFPPEPFALRSVRSTRLEGPTRQQKRADKSMH